MDETGQLASLINKDLGSQEEGMLIPLNGIDYNIMREKLEILIMHLIENNFEKLCQAMYRLDVSETKFHQVMTEKPFDEIPSSITDLVIEREMMKVKTRMMHKRGDL
jgi:hypothetical protein